jgi:glycosyltransferase involved in cell wall biosynthesis
MSRGQRQRGIHRTVSTGEISMKISIITPSFNQGQFIERTLLSVANQTGGEIEHVVFDGKSNDNTLTILKNTPSLTHWVSEQDNGQTDAVNKGILATSGDIIGWLNSDDIYYPGAIAAVLDFFATAPDVDVVYGMADHIDANDMIIEPYPTQPWTFEQLQITCFICQPALFFRRRLVEKYGLLDESLNYCMDYEYWLRLGQAGVRFHYLEKKLAGSRLYSENKTIGSRVKVHREINNMLKQKLGKVPDSWLFAYAHAIVEAKTLREQQPNWFVLKLLLTSLWSTVRWNKTITDNFRKTLYSIGLNFCKNGTHK